MNYLGIDLGTSSVKIVVMEKKGKIIYETSRSYNVNYSNGNWAEQDPDHWWIQTLDALKEIFNNNLINSKSISSIGFSGQMHGLVALDIDGNTLMPAILWNDQRTQAECDEITNHFGSEKLGKIVANKALTGFTAPKILWVKKNRPEIFSKIDKIMLPKDYIRYKLTNAFATDYSDASGTLLLDIENKKWSDDMLDYIGIRKNQLPELYESYAVTGFLDTAIKDILNIDHDIKVVGGAGDQAAGAIGTGTVKSGIVSVTLGTSGVVFVAHDEFKMDPDKRLHSFCHSNGKYHSMGVMLSAANSLDWWVKDIQNEAFDLLLDEAKLKAKKESNIQFLPYLMGERTPYADPDAKACFIGLDMHSKRPDMTKAVLEGVAFGLKDSLEILKDMGIPIDEIRLIGGGSKSDYWRQILANIFNEKVYRINTNQGGALGAAILAAVGDKAYDSVENATDSIIKSISPIVPEKEMEMYYSKKYKNYVKLYGLLKDYFKQI